MTDSNATLPIDVDVKGPNNRITSSKPISKISNTPSQGPLNNPPTRRYFKNARRNSSAQHGITSTPQNLSPGHQMASQQMMGGRSPASTVTNNPRLQNPPPVTNAIAGHYQVPQFGVPMNGYHPSIFQNPAAPIPADGLAPGAAMQENQPNRDLSSSDANLSTFQSTDAMLKQMTRKDQQILALQNAVKEKDHLLSLYQISVNRKNGLMSAYSSEVNAKNQIIGVLQSELKDREQRIQILSRDLEISKLKNRLAVYEEDKEILELRKGLEARAAEKESAGPSRACGILGGKDTEMHMQKDGDEYKNSADGTVDAPMNEETKEIL